MSGRVLLLAVGLEGLATALLCGALWLAARRLFHRARMRRHHGCIPWE